MSRFLDSSELREAAELLREIYRPESDGDTKMSPSSEEGQTPIKRSNESFERVENAVMSNETTKVDAAFERSMLETEPKRPSVPSEKRSVSVPLRQRSEELTAFSLHNQQENANVSSRPLTVENRTGPDNAISEPEPEKPTPFAAILANQQSQKKKLEQNSPFRTFQDSNSDIINPKSDNSPASGKTSGGGVTTAWLEKARNEINDLDRGTKVQESNLSEVGGESITTTEDERGLAAISANEKQKDLIPSSTFGLNKEGNSVRSDTLPKRPVWPWEKKEEKPKPIIAIPEKKIDSTTESGEAKENPRWPWTQK